MQNFNIRTAKPPDAAALLEIYAPYVLNTAITFEYTVPSLCEFENRIKHTLVKYPYLVYEKDGKPAGYAYAGEFKSRAAYVDSVELSVYTDASLKRQGIGSALYSELERILKLQNVYNLNACIAYTDNEDEHLSNASMHFHAHLGYRTVGKFTKCGYKFSTWYDMIWMEKLISPHPDFPKDFIYLSKL